MREREGELSRITKFRVKMQESGGIKLANLFSTDLTKNQPCGRQDCPRCTEGDGKTNCKKSSILYESKCATCNPKQPRGDSSQQEENAQPRRVGIKIGESSRSLYERNKEDVNDAEKFQEGSHIVKH